MHFLTSSLFIPLQIFASRNFKIRAVSTADNQASTYIPAAPIFLPEGPWKQVIF
jgi:glutamate N-acetyltransferase/amino-acid N-acetyltransferase